MRENIEDLQTYRASVKQAVHGKKNFVYKQAI